MTPSRLGAARRPGRGHGRLVDLAAGVVEADGLAAVTAVTEQHSAPESQTRGVHRTSVGNEIDQMLYFVYGMLGIAVLIALMGIANTLSLSIHERPVNSGCCGRSARAAAQVRRRCAGSR